MDNERNPEFLRQKYQLEKSQEVDRAVKKKEGRGERVRNVPSIIWNGVLGDFRSRIKYSPTSF